LVKTISANLSWV